MTTTTVHTVVTAAQRLSVAEQLEVIQALTRVLQQRYWSVGVPLMATEQMQSTLPAYIRRTPPITNLADFAADFWPEDETADDINRYLAQQRAADRLLDLPDDDTL